MDFLLLILPSQAVGGHHAFTQEILQIPVVMSLLPQPIFLGCFHIAGTAVNTGNNNPYCLAISFIVLCIIYNLLVGKPLRQTKSIGHYATVIAVYKNHSKNHQI